MIGDISNSKIGIIGLGYVGLPLAIAFSKKYEVVGFDINDRRVNELRNGFDSTLEISTNELDEATKLSYSNDIKDLSDVNVYIVTVPTPIDKHKRPDLTPLIRASEMLGGIICHGDIVIYESTVYPGATEDDCIPVIEKISGLQLNKDFFAGYSPERINPGDKSRSITDIKKVTSGSTIEVAEAVDKLYLSIISAGTFKASSIKVAEAAKVIENVQRDVNIALVNEFYQIFTNMGINTHEVLEAASTKWNFQNLKPGLVGGHCISVDPYYLLHKSGEKGYIPDLIRTGREINDGMSSFLINDFIKNLIKNKINPVDLEVLVLGFTFKENCPDIRNTKVYDIYLDLERNGFRPKVFDPIADYNDVYDNYGVSLLPKSKAWEQKVAFLAVGHHEIMSKLETFNFTYIYDYKGIVKL